MLEYYPHRPLGNSGEFFVMVPLSQVAEPPANPARFKCPLEVPLGPSVPRTDCPSGQCRQQF
jgi:hypothetical protein